MAHILTPEPAFEEVPRRTPRPEMRSRLNSWVYVLRNDAQQALYIGTTRSPYRRMREHSLRQPWWPEVERVGWLLYPDKSSVLSAEAELTRWFRPLHNRPHPHTLPLRVDYLACYDDHVSEVLL